MCKICMFYSNAKLKVSYFLVGKKKRKKKNVFRKCYQSCHFKQIFNTRLSHKDHHERAISYNCPNNKL